MSEAEHADELHAVLDEYHAARAYSLALVEALTPVDISWRPDENSSAIAWHLGHQAAVNHYMMRNLTAAEPSINATFDALFDSATPERARGALPALAWILDYRHAIGARTAETVDRIADGGVGAPAQLALVARGVLTAVVNHEYQHAKWIDEVRSTLTGVVSPTPTSDALRLVDGYYVLDPSGSATTPGSTAGRR